MTSTFTAWAIIAALFSEVKFVCVRIPPFPRGQYVNKALTSA